ncbi:unnamed protein product [Zymoseptoria tritici ST99CH_3D7]|uniref:Uncharacterized protein n=1 Tax=Zymoseptoria tritici (strain ST99CH_3D7) TaxID=1276538 RepID=A0A1X7S9V6_ZYMT9|nr:unnamed protein product [Zymoseptoria tritici ST99CH_3D7]
MVKERIPPSARPRASLSQTKTTTPVAREQLASKDPVAVDLEREAAEAQLLRKMLEAKYQEQCSEQLLRELEDSVCAMLSLLRGDVQGLLTPAP